MEIKMSGNSLGQISNWDKKVENFGVDMRDIWANAEIVGIGDNWIPLQCRAMYPTLLEYRILNIAMP